MTKSIVSRVYSALWSLSVMGVVGCGSSGDGAGADGGSAGTSGSTVSPGDLSECDFNVDATGNGPNGFITDNACSYMLTYEGGSPITGACNITTDASESTRGVTLLFIGGTRRDAMPYEHLEFMFQTPNGRLSELVGYHYELGDMLDPNSHLSFTFSHMSALGMFDAENITVSCQVLVDRDDGSMRAVGDSITFDVDEAMPVCVVGETTAYEIHGSFIGNCQGTFGAPGPNSSEAPVKVEITF